MTRVLALLSVLAIGVVGCSVNHRSGDFECTSTSECTASLGTGFTCSNGLCLSTTTPPVDAPPGTDGMIDAGFVCPSQCTSCRQDSHTCRVDCGISPATCNSPINCPAGFNCEINCTSSGGCQNINCTDGASCQIICKSTTSCKSVTCGATPCDLTCEGSSSCAAVDCHNSCQCDVACQGSNSCGTAPVCPGIGDTCKTFGINVKGCDSNRIGCDTCP